MKNAIVIPCYNESERLPFELFKTFLTSHSDFVCCFVNDGSKDDTLTKLQAFQLSIGNQVIIYDMPQNGGKAEAVRAGVSRMLEISSVQTIGFLDADLATGFDDYKCLLSSLVENNLSMTFGSRKLDSCADIDRSFFRDSMSKAIGLMISTMLNLPIKDTQCGAKVFSRQAAATVFADGFISKWLFDVEIFFRMKRLFAQQVMTEIGEIPLQAWNDVEGSKLGLKDVLQIPLMLSKIAFANALVPQTEVLIKSLTKRPAVSQAA